MAGSATPNQLPNPSQGNIAAGTERVEGRTERNKKSGENNLAR